MQILPLPMIATPKGDAIVSEVDVAQVRDQNFHVLV